MICGALYRALSVLNKPILFFLGCGVIGAGDGFSAAAFALALSAARDGKS